MDVVDLVMADHREVERMFEVLRTQPDQRPLITPMLVAAMVAHSRAEESEVYPVAKREAGEVDEIAHSQHEHAEAEQLLAQLADNDPHSSRYESLLQTAADAIGHHVEEEESTVLPQMRERLDERRLEALATAFVRARADCLAHAGSLTAEQAHQAAANADLPGRSSMSKEEIVEGLEKAE